MGIISPLAIAMAHSFLAIPKELYFIFVHKLLKSHSLHGAILLCFALVNRSDECINQIQTRQASPNQMGLKQKKKNTFTHRSWLCIRHNEWLIV